MAKNKINEATAVASSRSRSRLEKDNSKLKAGARHQDGTAPEIPEWAKDMPEYITVKVWDLD